MAEPEPFLTGASIYQQLEQLRAEIAVLKTVLSMALAHLVMGTALEEATALRWLEILDGTREVRDA